MFARFANRLNDVGFRRGMVAGILTFQLASTIFESVGLSMLLPIFELIQSGQSAVELAKDSRHWQVLIDIYDTIGLSVTIPVLLVSSFIAIILRQILIYMRVVYMAYVRFILIRRLRDRGFRAFLGARLGPCRGTRVWGVSPTI